ncbi:zonular occludens toxin domain-containing protein [Xylella fastidiosa]|uniref:zonular occludens toxin domain-containing protein n=1 Tax=Xylella fastidiosa TaxID=2371 RepID=UPI001E313C24|nr:zonular occludens toxin domain-containing protein [Xylella fastidiosa]
MLFPVLITLILRGFDVEAVRRLTGYVVQSAPEDWRTTPQGSVIVYDEAHRIFSAGRPGRSDDPRVCDLDTHRHGGYDLMFVTQWPTKIHHELRRLVGEHVHLNRAMGLQTAGLYRWSRAQDDPYDIHQRDKAEEEVWKFPKDRYALYASSTLHTVSHKFRIPKKVWSALSVCITCSVIGFVFWHYYSPAHLSEAASSVAGASGQASLRAAPASLSSSRSLVSGMRMYAALETESAPTLSGCVSSDRSCRCFNTDGYQIDMSVVECRGLLASPLPFNVYHAYVTSSSAAVSSSPSSSPSSSVSLSSSVSSAPILGSSSVPSSH